MNMYVENVESQMGRGPLSLYPTPGLNLVYQLGGAPMRGIITHQARTFAVQGTILWELLAGGGTVNRSTVPVPSDGRPVSMAGGGTQLLIASQQRTYVFDLVANTLTEVTANVGSPVAQVGYSDGFFLALIAGTASQSSKVQASKALDATTWPGASATVVSVFSDQAVGFFVDHREMWIFGPKAIQPYYDSGNFPFPFDIIQGAYIEEGLGAPFGVCKADNSLFWITSSIERGNGKIVRANGYQPTRVSNHALEYALQGYSTISDCVAYSYQDQGHEFAVFSFPTAGKTWVYDAATAMWHERAFWDTVSATFKQHRAMFHTFNFGQHLVGDPTTGNVYQMAIPVQVGGGYQFVSDFGQAIRRVRRAPHISREQQYIAYRELQVDVETGLGPVPPLQGTGTPTTIYLADANGVTWAVNVSDIGDLKVAPPVGGSPNPGLLFFNDSGGDGTSWQITVSILGVLQPIPVTANPNYPLSQIMVSNTGLTIWQFFVTDLGGGLAVLKTSKTGIVTRGPQMILRWSNDSAHTWSNDHAKDCGQAGEYIKRVIWRRLGVARDRVYEISMTDAIPWRIVDAYLKADPEYGPQERLTKELAKRA